ncbi:MAG: right-handed parallel beta-helix repeat-containing protein [Bacteroidetes bacterium]|nr:right-handed parallel beta-helix repeat-containing protein [Bacteroidota bacterium]
MNKSAIFLILLSLSGVFCLSQTIVPAGDVSGTWNAEGSPYLVEGEITVQAGNTLIIEPGVNVEFQINCALLVTGRILAEGTENDTILFSAAGTSGHRGVRMASVDSLSDTCFFRYCRFQDGNGIGTWPDNCGPGIAVMNFNKVVVEHCLFIDNKAWTGTNAAGGAIAFQNADIIIRNNSFINNRSSVGGAMMVYACNNAIIENNYFYDNYATKTAGVIAVWDHSNPLIKNNIFEANHANQFGGAIEVYLSSNPQISHNLFVDNYSLIDGGAIELNAYCNPLIINNTIVNNSSNNHGGGIDIYDESSPRLINNIYWGNESPSGCQIYIYSDDCIPDFYFNDIQYGQDSIEGAPILGQWKANIDLYPIFVDTASNNFHLEWDSPCINAGVDTILDPDGTISDIGAYYYHIINPGINEQNNKQTLTLNLYPNPAVSVLTVSYGTFTQNSINELGIPNDQDMEVTIFDLRGSRVSSFSLPGSYKSKNQFTLDVSDLPSGIYSVRLKVAGADMIGKFIRR